MFSSLRTRLWLSYALVILGALFVTAVILVIYLLRSPLAFRQATARLRAVESVILPGQTDLNSLSQPALQKALQINDKTFNIRILVYTSNREVLADSRRGSASAFVTPRLLQLLHNGVGLRDTSGKLWLYTVSRMEDGNFLVLATPRPKVALLTILRDEFVPPFAVAGVIALLVSLLVAFGLARWIGDPLQRVVVASRRMPSMEVNSIAPGGPHEVRELTRAFNEMNMRVLTSQKAQREFVANVSHELKTPLTSVQGFAQALLDGTASTPLAQKQAAQVIYNESERMHRMVLDLLDLARLDAGTLDLQCAPVDLTALLNSIAEKFAPQARTSNVNILVEMASLPAFTGDGDRLAQVFTNLVDNALKFTPAGGRITLRSAQVGSEIQVEVIDTGEGISPDALPHIFDRFYQADPSRPGGRKHGSGLGLTIVKENVGAHSGKISVRSEPGMGSTFTIILPLTTPETSTIVSKRKT
jgi:two-component system OmpR family sensor kinase